MGWQDDARRTVVSEKRMLTKMEGYWVKVRLWSIKGRDEISAAERDMRKTIDRKALFEVSKKVKGIDPEKLKAMDTGDMLDLLNSDEFDALTNSATMESARVVETKLRHGIESHNFCDGDIDTRSTDKDIKGFASQIIEYSEVAQEILAFVEEFNRPLAKPNPSNSETQQNGSTKEASLNSETPFLTEVVQRS